AHEKTYSAPFATHLYTKETIELENGQQVRDYKRLDHGGIHLIDTSDRGSDIARHFFIGLIKGGAVWLLFGAVVIIVLSSRWHCSTRNVIHTIRFTQKERLPWRTIFVTIGVLFVIVALATQLGTRYHILGTDKVGQDVFYQTIKSIRTGLVIGTLTTLIMLPFAIMLGIMAGYFRGWIDDVIQYVYTTLSSIPGVLLITAAILILQVYMANNPDAFGSLTERADIRLLFLCIILGITSWTGLCRLLRGETMKLRDLDYVQAAAAFGVGHFTIIMRHILPNVMHIVLISVVLDFSGLVLAEAVLSYVGVGVDPSMISWGNMINSARLEMAREPVVWWPLLASFILMFVLVLCANLFSDAVRDAFDPRLKQRD
ncbi:MAG: ABC transporter permease, partial [Gammaproteobacteria bacterium]|nr:ABC transporter permease [Gammaproteobacteria bacterium]